MHDTKQHERMPRLFPDWVVWTAGALAVAVLAAFAIVGVIALKRGGLTPKDPAITSVERVLELRKAGNKDPKAYAPYFSESSVATALADEAKNATSSASPIPDWDTPYVSEQTSSTKDVTVVWKRPAGYADFPKAVIFQTRERAGRWVIVDALEVTGTVPPPAEKK